MSLHTLAYIEYYVSAYDTYLNFGIILRIKIIQHQHRYIDFTRWLKKKNV